MELHKDKILFSSSSPFLDRGAPDPVLTCMRNSSGSHLRKGLYLTLGLLPLEPGLHESKPASCAASAQQPLKKHPPVPCPHAGHCPVRAGAALHPDIQQLMDSTALSAGSDRKEGRTPTRSLTSAWLMFPLKMGLILLTGSPW